ncbi:hypothetical protein [Mesorhizobium sp. M0207]|uniref:hypothetical protein n=2 Tax=unclassified Mesorhizobium TaxID=325217 RepID=UPI003334DDC4
MFKILETLPFLIASAACLSACGTVTPNIQEFWGSPLNAEAMESEVMTLVACELGHAVSNISTVVDKNPQLAGDYGFLNKWNAQVALTFQVDEQSSVNPTPSFVSKLHPLVDSETFTLGLSGNYKNQATRIDKVSMTYRIKDFVGKKFERCEYGGTYRGTLFVKSNLKIEDWLSASLNVAVSNGPSSKFPVHPKFGGKADTISHDVKFLIVSSGGVAPVWKLVEFGTGQNPLVFGQRDRVQQLVITMAPADLTDPSALGPAGQFSSLASQINSQINSGRISP